MSKVGYVESCKGESMESNTTRGPLEGKQQNVPRTVPPLLNEDPFEDISEEEASMDDSSWEMDSSSMMLSKGKTWE